MIDESDGGSGDRTYEESIIGDGLVVNSDRKHICGWPTDTVTIDHVEEDVSLDKNAARTDARTLILFVPGNPGVVHWYTNLLTEIVKQLGKRFAARGISYAGHGVGEDVVGTKHDHSQSFDADDQLGNKCEEPKVKGSLRDMRVAWTMDGQIEHKIKWIDDLLEEEQQKYESSPGIVFLSHSIGAHFVQCILLRRPDILAKTGHIIHLTPFVRFDPPPLKKIFLSSSAHSYKYAIPMIVNLVGVLSSSMSQNWIDAILEKAGGIKCTNGRKIALEIFSNPDMMRNHLVLGSQEVRDLPEHPNVRPK
ncbi:hypothetical protein ACHAWF_008079 [Thalassiosira exigua]